MSKWLAPQCPLVVCATSVQDPLKLAAIAEEETADMLAAAKAPARTKTRVRRQTMAPSLLAGGRQYQKPELVPSVTNGPLNQPTAARRKNFRMQYDNTNTRLGPCASSASPFM
jgi:hypothetical protein